MTWEVKPTLAGLVEALNTLLANGVDPSSEVSLGTYRDESDGFVGSLVFDGIVDVETVGGQGPMLRVIISEDADYEVLPLDQRRFHCSLTCVPRADGSCDCGCAGCRAAPGKTAKWKARVALRPS